MLIHFDNLANALLYIDVAMHVRGSTSCVKAAGREADRLPPNSAEVNNSGAIPSRRGTTLLLTIALQSDRY
jgi:hypothetical protein